MSDSKLTPLNWKNPIVHDDGTPTAYFIQLMQTLLEEKEATEDNLADFSIDELSDVDTVSTPPTDGQGLVWDDGLQQWVPGTVASSGGQVAFQGCLVKKSADQTAANYSTAAAVTWDVDVYDTNGFHSTTSNTSRITIPAGVTKVRLGYQMYLTAHVANEYVASYITKNGSSTWTGWASTYQETPLTTVSGVAWTPVVNVSEGDYFEVFLDTQSDTSITVEEEFNWFACEVIQSNSVFEGTTQGALVYKSADQTAVNASGAGVNVTWDSESYDTLGFHDTSSNTSRFTIPAGVTKVRLSAQIVVSGGTGTSGTYSGIQITKNGSIIYPGAGYELKELTFASHTNNAVTGVLSVSTGDYFECLYFEETDTSVTIEADQSWFCIEVIGVTQALGTSYAGCKVVKAADLTGQNLTAGAVITWDTEIRDTHGFHSTSSNTSRLTIPAGITKVRITGALRINNIAASSVPRMFLSKNGSTALVQISGHNPSTSWGGVFDSGVLSVSEGDYFEMSFQNDTDTSVDITAATSFFDLEVVEYTTPRTNTFSGCLLTKTADETAANYSAGVMVPWTSEVYDTDGFHSTSSNTSRITIPIGGKYVFKAGIVVSSATVAGGEYARSTLAKNGSTTAFPGQPSAFMEPDANITLWNSWVSAPIDCSAGDYFEVWLDMEADISITVVAASWFSCERVDSV